MNNLKRSFIALIIIFLSTGHTCKKDPLIPVLPHQEVVDVTVDQAIGLIDSLKSLIILDVRTPSEFTAGHIANAINIDFYSETFSSKIDSLEHYSQYLVYCRSGNRSKSAVGIMKEKGFTTLYNMLGGFSQWLDKGYPVEY